LLLNVGYSAAKYKAYVIQANSFCSHFLPGSSFTVVISYTLHYVIQWLSRISL